MSKLREVTEMLTELKEVREAALRELEGLSDLEALDGWRVAYLGKKGKVTQLVRSVGKLPREERPEFGKEANRVKGELEAAYEARLEDLRREALARSAEKRRLDVSLPGRPQRVGGLHLVTQTLHQIYTIFAQMGFQIVEGPEVERDRYNFELLNMPPDHPARDMWDTIYIAPPYCPEKEMLLRTHTSPVQIRAMEAMEPPIRVIAPGRCYRYEAVDASHEWMFYQVEGLAVGEGITMADLKGVLTSFTQQMFGMDRKVRFRCDYFPFVEPGVDMSMDCIVCGGKGCRVCKHTGWLEILGAGMVHPNVLAGVNIDPEKYTGFAFGMGPERIAMLQHGIDDIRLFYSNDLRFLRQFN